MIFFTELPANTRITLLNPENYQEKLKIVDQLKSNHMSTWKANQVLAWLEIVLNMPVYGKKCATNIKSGKVSKQILYLTQPLSYMNIILFFRKAYIYLLICLLLPIKVCL